MRSTGEVRALAAHTAVPNTATHAHTRTLVCVPRVCSHALLPCACRTRAYTHPPAQVMGIDKDFAAAFAKAQIAAGQRLPTTGKVRVCVPVYGRVRVCVCARMFGTHTCVRRGAARRVCRRSLRRRPPPRPLPRARNRRAKAPTRHPSPSPLSPTARRPFPPRVFLLRFRTFACIHAFTCNPFIHSTRNTPQVFISMADKYKPDIISVARDLGNLGFGLVATSECAHVYACGFDTCACACVWGGPRWRVCMWGPDTLPCRCAAPQPARPWPCAPRACRASRCGRRRVTVTTLERLCNDFVTGAVWPVARVCMRACRRRGSHGPPVEAPLPRRPALAARCATPPPHRSHGVGVRDTCVCVCDTRVCLARVCAQVFKIQEGRPNPSDLIRNGEITLVMMTSR
jgi:hypothetical protein